MTMHAADSRYAWQRLAASTLLCALGSFSMWGVVVIFPALQAEFAASRADVSFSYTSTMVGFGTGVVLFGRMIDARGAFTTLLLATALLVAGCFIAAFAPNLWVFVAAQGILIGFGSAAAFIPLMADISHWFIKRRALAMAISASGNYVGGAIWPKVTDLLTQGHDWRTTYLVVGAVCLVGMLPCCFVLRPRSPVHAAGTGPATAPASPGMLGLSPAMLQLWLAIAGFGCCIAMSMPQVHIVAYCVDLGYGTARGAEMLSLMTATGVISRIGSGWIADRIGGMKTALLGSTLQAMALLAYLISDSLMSIYLVSALFGLVQGGIVPSYGVIVREYYPPKEAGTRMGITIACTIVGMAVGGWMGGVAFDLTGSYRAAFLNGFAWNVVNGIVLWWLLTRQNRVVPA
ncbi:MAG: MFS transporter [Alphaproteobacteria bacterium]|nr:MFS transporter [Alphaproteobacteria bacterium]